ENIKKVKTKISDGLAVLEVEYEYKSDVDDKYQELIREVNTLRETLPDGIQRMEVNKFEPSDVNILQMELVSENASRDQLRTSAKDLEDRLEKIEALKNVEIQGLPDEIIRVDLNMSKMAQ